MLALAEFAVESIIREGLNDMKDGNVDIRLEDALGRITQNDLLAKYGAEEIAKVKEFLLRGDVHIVHALSQLQEGKIPAFSIHLLSDTEDDSKAAFQDYDGEDCQVIEPAVIVDTFTATSYDPATGKVSVPNTVDLQNVYKNRIFVDGDGLKFTIDYPICNVKDDKFFPIPTDIDPVPNLVGAKIISSVDRRVFEVRYTPTSENVMIGVHTENALLTRYLYYVLRYLLYRKRDKFQEYQLQLSKYDGSDFSLNQMAMPENVKSRWITAHFTTYNFWRDKEYIVFDAVNPSMGGVGPFYRVVIIFTPLTYTPSTGVVTVADSVDLSQVVAGDYFFDASGYEFIIEGGISNVNGSKQFKIQTGQTVDLSLGASIKRMSKVRVGAGPEEEHDRTWESIE